MISPSHSAADGSVDIGQIIDRAGLSRLQILLIALCACAGIFDGFDLQVMGYLAPAIAQTLHLPIANLGTVFAVSFFGVAAGSSLVAPLADRVGRKRLIVASIALFAVATGFTAAAKSYGALMGWRAITGIGLGAAMPNLITLTAEFAPQRLRALLVTALFSGLSAGAMLGGVVSSLLLKDFGWRAVFAVGSVGPLILIPFIVGFLPESIRYLVLQDNQQARIAAILQRIDPTFLAQPHTRFVTAETRARRAAFGELFTRDRAAGTLALWLSFFMNLFILVFLASWLPTLLRDGGVALDQAIMAVVVMNLGGVLGSAVVGYAMDRLAPRPVLSTIAATCALLMTGFALAIGHPTSLAVIMGCTFLIGLCVQGGQSGLNAFAAGCYPTTIRSTGVGWAFGVGRLGSIVAPLIGGWALRLQWTHTHIFMAAAVPMAIEGLAILLVRMR